MKRTICAVLLLASSMAVNAQTSETDRKAVIYLRDNIPAFVQLQAECERDIAATIPDTSERSAICVEKTSPKGEYSKACLTHYLKSIVGKPSLTYLLYRVATSCALRERPEGLPEGVPSFHELTNDQRLTYAPFVIADYAKELKDLKELKETR